MTVVRSDSVVARATAKDVDGESNVVASAPVEIGGGTPAEPEDYQRPDEQA